MKYFFLLFSIAVSQKFFGQNDTTIYYSNLQKTIDSKGDAAYYESLTKKSKDLYVLKTYSREDNKWKKISEDRIQRTNDSSFLITSEINPGQRIIRHYHKTNNVYSVSDYEMNILRQEGTSKLIFPLIKDGYWKEYNKTSGKLNIEGQYSDNQLISDKYWITESEFVNDVFFGYDKNPEYEGGDSELLKYIRECLVYPEPARKNGISGKVMVTFILMNDGTLKGVHPINKNDPMLENEAIRVIKSIPNKWHPAEIGNRKVNIPYLIPITFSLTEITRGI